MPVYIMQAFCSDKQLTFLHKPTKFYSLQPERLTPILKLTLMFDALKQMLQ